MKQMTDQVISIVCPLSQSSDFVCTQVAGIYSLCQKTYDQFEIIIINDGLSISDSAAIADLVLGKKEGLRLIQLAKQVGFDIAVRAGLDSCIGDFVLVFDLTTDPVEKIPELIQLSVSTNKVVLGIKKTNKNDPFHVRWGRCLFYHICNQYLGLNFLKNTTYLTVIPRKVLNFVISNQDKFSFIKLITAQIGIATHGYEYDFIEGRTRHRRSFWKSVDLSIKVVTGETIAPLRIVASGALILSALNLFYVGYVFIIYLFKVTVAEGWTTLSLQISVGLFIIFLILAIISEYLSVILMQIRPSALYHILDERSSQNLIANSNRLNVLAQSTTGKP